MKRLLHLLPHTCAIALAIFLCTKSTAEEARPSGLKVTATISAQTVIRGRAAFKAKLLVENPTAKTIRFSTMTCSWNGNWKTDTNRMDIAAWACNSNVPEIIEIRPGGSFTDEFDVYVDPKIAPGKVTFRFGFTSMDGKETSWSNKVEALVDPNAPKPDDAALIVEDATRTLGKGCHEMP